jgi:hypothetical protein
MVRPRYVKLIHKILHRTLTQPIPVGTELIWPAKLKESGFCHSFLIYGD